MAAMGAIRTILFFVLAVAVPAHAAKIDLPGAKACFMFEGGPSLDAQIAGCTAVIGSPLATPQIRASAHHNRGAAYYNSALRVYNVANLEKSIADFQAALKLDPKLAGAQNGLKRARAALQEGGVDMSWPGAKACEGLDGRPSQDAQMHSRVAASSGDAEGQGLGASQSRRGV
jgi:tetratricopeptide (TPR) repeat protein